MRSSILAGYMRVQRTRPDFLLATSASLLEFIDSIDSYEDLNCRDRVQHMSIVTRGSTKASIVILARKDEVDGLISR
jgi:hypothetical protein